MQRQLEDKLQYYFSTMAVEQWRANCDFEREKSYLTRDVVYYNSPAMSNSLCIDDVSCSMDHALTRLTNTMCFNVLFRKSPTSEYFTEAMSNDLAIYYTIPTAAATITAIHRFCAREHEINSQPRVSYFRYRNVFVWTDIIRNYKNYLGELFVKTFNDNQWGLRSFKSLYGGVVEWRVEKIAFADIFDIGNRLDNDRINYYFKEGYECLTRKNLEFGAIKGDVFAVNHHPLKFLDTRSGDGNISIIQWLSFSEAGILSRFNIVNNCGMTFNNYINFSINDFFISSKPRDLYGDTRFMTQTEFSNKEDALMCEAFITKCINQINRTYGNWCLNFLVSPSFKEIPNMDQIKIRIADTNEFLGICAKSTSYCRGFDFVHEHKNDRLKCAKSITRHIHNSNDINMGNLNTLNHLADAGRLDFLYKAYERELGNIINPSVYYDGVKCCDTICDSCHSRVPLFSNKLHEKRSDSTFFKTLSSCLFLDLTERSFLIKIWLIFSIESVEADQIFPRELQWIVVNHVLNFQLLEETYLDMSQFQNSTLKFIPSIIGSNDRIQTEVDHEGTYGSYSLFLWKKYGVILFRHPIYRRSFVFNIVSDNTISMNTSFSGLHAKYIDWDNHPDYTKDMPFDYIRMISEMDLYESTCSPFNAGLSRRMTHDTNYSFPMSGCEDILIFLPTRDLIESGLVKGRLSQAENVFRCMENADKYKRKFRRLLSSFVFSGVSDDTLGDEILGVLDGIESGAIERDYFGARRYCVTSPKATDYHTCVRTDEAITIVSNSANIRSSLIDNPRFFDLSRDVILSVDERGRILKSKEPKGVFTTKKMERDLREVSVRLFGK